MFKFYISMGCLFFLAASPFCYSQDAVDGHEVMEAPKNIVFESSVGNVLFPHNLHVEDLDMDCMECHHQIHAIELDTPHPDYLKSSWIKCQICHDANSEMSKKYYKCSACHHSDLDDIADETLSSKVVLHKNCWNCHASGTGAQSSESCSDCHVKETK